MKPVQPIPASTVHEIHDQCLCFAAQKAARALARRFDRVFAPLRLTNGQFSMMVVLQGKGAPRLGELADFLAMDQTTLTAAVKSLEARGLVTRQADDADRRARRVSLTEAGRALIVQALPLWRAEIALLRAEVTPGQADHLAGLLHRIGTMPQP
jgi:DNA-binding MarR family transcriptional regulator